MQQGDNNIITQGPDGVGTDCRENYTLNKRGCHGYVVFCGSAGSEIGGRDVKDNAGIRFFRQAEARGPGSALSRLCQYAGCVEERVFQFRYL